jgi:hypothetical protein
MDLGLQLASGIDDRGRIAGFYLNPNFTPSTEPARPGAPMEALPAAMPVAGQER